MLFVGDETHTVVTAAEAWVLSPVFQIESVVVSKFLALGDVAKRVNPNPTSHDVRLTIRGAGVIDEPRGIPTHSAINVGAFVELKNVNGSTTCLLGFREESLGAALRFSFRNVLADVLDDRCVGWNVPPGENATVMNV